MPNWKIHIEIAKRLNEKFNYKDIDKELFLLGSVLPDVNNGFIVEDISRKLEHKITHYNTAENPSYIEFYNRYTNEMGKNPLITGYFVHLFTDYFWNNDFYTKYETRGNKELTFKEKQKLKRGDFKRFNNNFHSNFIEMSDFNRMMEQIKKIDEVSITQEDIKKVINFIKTQPKFKNEYNFYTDEELIGLLEDTVEEVKLFLKMN
ncbi:MAG: zinc dependent phospholipase C family protein [Clostridia bacterium]|nr:zinc dependent phospholipase C family protein [Clostridia bacterium]